MRTRTRAQRDAEPITRFSGHEYGYLSNGYRRTVVHEGVAYPSVAHALQAAKITDLPTQKLIAAGVPHKRMPVRADWEAVQYNVLVRLLTDKFTRHGDLCAQLLATGERVLIDGDQENVSHLGRALMEVRDGLARGVLTQIPPPCLVCLRREPNAPFGVFCGPADSCPPGWHGPGADGCWSGDDLENPLGAPPDAPLWLKLVYALEYTADGQDRQMKMEPLRGKRLGCLCTSAEPCCHRHLAPALVAWFESGAGVAGAAVDDRAAHRVLEARIVLRRWEQAARPRRDPKLNVIEREIVRASAEERGLPVEVVAADLLRCKAANLYPYDVFGAERPDWVDSGWLLMPVIIYLTSLERRAAKRLAELRQAVNMKQNRRGRTVGHLHSKQAVPVVGTTGSGGEFASARACNFYPDLDITHPEDRPPPYLLDIDGTLRSLVTTDTKTVIAHDMTELKCKNLIAPVGKKKKKGENGKKKKKRRVYADITIEVRGELPTLDPSMDDNAPDLPPDLTPEDIEELDVYSIAARLGARRRHDWSKPAWFAVDGYTPTPDLMDARTITPLHNRGGERVYMTHFIHRDLLYRALPLTAVPMIPSLFNGGLAYLSPGPDQR